MPWALTKRRRRSCYSWTGFTTWYCVCRVRPVYQKWLHCCHSVTKSPLHSRRLRLPEFLDNQHMKVIRLSALCTGRLFAQEIPLVLISVSGWIGPEAIVQPEFSHWEILMTQSGIEPTTFKLVTQCLNQLCHHIPSILLLIMKGLGLLGCDMCLWVRVLGFLRQWRWRDYIPFSHSSNTVPHCRWYESSVNSKSPL
jgi:hypothetical protein